MAKKYVWSFSSINLFRTCPNQWRAKYRDKEVEFKPTTATIWGNEVHKEAELCLIENREPKERYALLKPVLKSIFALPGKKYAEKEVAVTKDLKPCGFWDNDAWLRGKMDVLVDQNDKALILDYKTGRAKPDDFEELRCFSALTFLNNPAIEKTKNVYLWLKNDSPPTSEIVDRKDVNELVDNLHDTILSIENSLASDVWVKKQSGLCRDWCDVTTCPKNGKYKGS